MKPTVFEESNVRLLKPESMTDEECGSLDVYTDGEKCISCWEMSFKERLSALIFGKVWLIVISGKTQPPVWLGCRKTVFASKRAAE